MRFLIPRTDVAVALLFALCALATTAPPAVAQCTPQWLVGDGMPGTDGRVLASTMWDPDGPGPLPARLVIAGDFTFAGSTAANRIAAWDPVTGIWSPFGAGMDGFITAVSAMPNGDLIAAGMFATAGGAAANNIARWNGASWTPLGTGLSSITTWPFPIPVSALTVLPNGDLVAGGTFFDAGGTPANRIAQWNGSTWRAIGTGIPSGSVLALTTDANGDLIVGGDFPFAGGVLIGGVLTGAITVNGIARWNGATWSPLGIGASAPGVASLLLLPNGDVIAGGAFTSMGGLPAANVARWNGTTWSSLGGGVVQSGWGVGQTSVRSMLALPNGDLVIGLTMFVTGSTSPVDTVQRWNGTSWTVFGPSILTGNVGETGVNSVTLLPNGDLVAAGVFPMAGNVNANNVARSNGSIWSALAAGTNARVSVLRTMPNGDLLAGGAFTTLGGVTANRVARWNGTAWLTLGSGVNDEVLALTTLPTGDVVAGGRFYAAGGVTADAVARWNGTTWSPLGAGMSGGLNTVNALTTMPNGDVIAGGEFGVAGSVQVDHVARWNGTTWSAIGPSYLGLFGATYALTTMPNGDLVVGGVYYGPAPLLARWDGTSWSNLGAGLGFGLAVVKALAVLPNGDLIAAGATSIATNANGLVVRWNGLAWSLLGGGMNGAVEALAVLPDGDLVAAGSFTTAGGIAANRVARWHGNAWTPFGSGAGADVAAVAFQPDGHLWIGGSFTTAGALTSSYIARLATPCPAAAIPFGTSCIGGGTNVLTVRSLPWLGSTLRSVADGLAGNAIALGVFGLSTVSTPLASILPQGVAGCTLLVSPDLLDAVLVTGASASLQLPIPDVSALAGKVLHQQVVPIALDAAGNLTALTSSNALTLTIGSF